MKTYIASTKSFSLILADHDAAQTELAYELTRSEAEATAAELKSNGITVSGIEENDDDFSIIGRRPYVLMTAFEKNGTTILDGYTEFQAEEYEMPYQADGKRFKRETIKVIAVH